MAKDTVYITCNTAFDKQKHAVWPLTCLTRVIQMLQLQLPSCARSQMAVKFSEVKSEHEELQVHMLLDRQLSNESLKNR